MSETGLPSPQDLQSPATLKWTLRKLRMPFLLKDGNGNVVNQMEFTIVAKVYGVVAVHPSIRMDSDGKGIEYMKDSHSVTAVACRLRLAWTRDEVDAFKIAQYLACYFPSELSFRSADKVMAALPNWVGAWIKECRKAGGTKGGYVSPPETTFDIEQLMEKYKRDLTRGQRTP